MKFKFLKAKALFQIFIMLLSIFTISLLNPKQAQAQTQQNYCCEKTTSGEFCQYTSSDNCDSSYNKAPSTCDKTQFCQPGCCVFKGSCSKSTGYSNCLNSGGTWKQDATCSIPECNKACCVIGSDCSLETQEICRERTSQYPDLSLDFRSEIQSEAACTEICRSTEKGCCVSQDGTCSYTSKGSCKDENFHSGTFCSDSSLKLDCSQCKPHATKKCIDEDIYWFDSCDNQENLAEDCNYESGTICSENFGPAKCISVNCASTYDSEHVDYDGASRKNGESWCMYEGATGLGFDLVGSRHYRNICINGKELIEPCKDYREEYCFQMDMQAGETYREAQCKPNHYADCITKCNTASSKTSEGALKTAMKKDKECCGKLGRDCYWSASQDNADLGKCIPLVPPGFAFWTSTNPYAAETSESSSTSTSQTPAAASGSNFCSKGNFECIVTWVKEDRFSDWECKANCECLTQDFAISSNAYCRALGDCGAHYNVIGKFTQDGFQCETEDGACVGERHGNKIDLDPLDLNKFGSFENYKKAGSGIYFGTFQVEDDMLQLYSASLASSATIYLTAKTLEFALSKGILEGVETFTKGALGKLLGQVATTKTAAPAAIGGAAPGAQPGTVVELNPAFVGIATFVIQFVMTGNFVKSAASGIATYIGYAIGGIIGGVIASVIIELIWGKPETDELTISIGCEPWQAPLGGSDCEKCTDEKLLSATGYNNCNEYRCKSLGQTCKLINQGTLKEKCIDSNPNDVNSPIISPDPTLLPQGYSANPSQYGFSISPLITPYTKFTFGIKTSEPAQCKIHNEHTSSYDQMPSTFLEPGTIFSLQHNMSLTAESGKEYSYYVRCIDASGNKNIAEYAITFASQIAPDKTPPVIELTSIDNNAVLPYNTTETQLSIYTNEPTNCKWSQQDSSYDEMENNFACLSSSSKLNFNLYPCLTELTNLTINNNALFFRCTDKAGNKNQESYKFNLIGTPNLQITSSQPSGTIFTNSPTLTITTAAGAETGSSQCAYSTQKDIFENSILFFNTGSSIHTQELLNLPEGPYSFFITCRDIAGNEAGSQLSFTIEKDTSPSRITQLYKDSIALHLILNEDSNCEYSDSIFEFGQGTQMTGQNTKEHTAALQNSYYIICKDLYENSAQFNIYTTP